MPVRRFLGGHADRYVLDVSVWDASKWARDFALADLEMIHYTEAGWDKRRSVRRQARTDE